MQAYDCFSYSYFVSSVGSIFITYADFIGNINGPNGVKGMRMAGFQTPVLNSKVQKFVQ